MKREQMRWAMGIALMIALVSAAGCGSDSPAGPSNQGDPPDLTIVINSMNAAQSYSPSAATVRVGQRVAWRNADAVAHTATADNGAFNTGIIAAGATSTPIVMNSAGTFPYHCTVHPTMVATMTVSQ